MSTFPHNLQRAFANVLGWNRNLKSKIPTKEEKKLFPPSQLTNVSICNINLMLFALAPPPVERCEKWHWMTGKWDHKIKSSLFHSLLTDKLKSLIVYVEWKSLCLKSLLLFVFLAPLYSLDSSAKRNTSIFLRQFSQDAAEKNSVGLQLEKKSRKEEMENESGIHMV